MSLRLVLRPASPGAEATASNEFVRRTSPGAATLVAHAPKTDSGLPEIYRERGGRRMAAREAYYMDFAAGLAGAIAMHLAANAWTSPSAYCFTPSGGSCG